MSTEHLTAEQSLKIYKIRASVLGDSVSADEADGFIAGYRAAMNEVEQQTKQLREERGDFHDLLIQLVECLDNGYDIKKGSPIHQEATRLLNQLNQQNEG